jgi:hypothetical protein
MAQPEYVPIDADDRVRPAERLPAPGRWMADRPAEIQGNEVPRGARFGSPGPDQGYALKLAQSFVADGRLRVGSEATEDAVTGCLGVALKRASLFGRAPVIYDLELAFGLFGFLDDGAPAELVAFRTPLFQAASHHYWDQRGIVDLVPDSTLRMSPTDVRARLSEWRSLLLV